MTNETLEEIFWKDRKFVKANGEEVKPEPVAEPFEALISYPIRNLDEIKRLIDFNLNYQECKDVEFNAFLKSYYPNTCRKERFEEIVKKKIFSSQPHCIQLYKI